MGRVSKSLQGDPKESSTSRRARARDPRAAVEDPVPVGDGLAEITDPGLRKRLAKILADRGGGPSPPAVADVDVSPRTQADASDPFL